MAEGGRGQNVFGRMAGKVDSFFQDRYYRIGLFVGTRPCVSIGATLLFCLLCAGGFSQAKSESRGDKLWIPQGTRAQDDEAAYTRHFPPAVRIESLLLEAKSGSALDRSFLAAAIRLHGELEAVTFEGENLTTLCVRQDSNGHPCSISSILGDWRYDAQVLSADSDPLGTLNSQGRSAEDLQRMLGRAQFGAGGQLVSAQALLITYFVRSNRVIDGGGYSDPKGEGWEEKVLELLKCGATEVTCDGSKCKCAYASAAFDVYPQMQRSFGDAFSEVIRGDVLLINGAFLIMALYLVLNLGGLCHKINSRVLLAFASLLSVVLGGVAGYGLSMWFQFDYTPVHSVLPFVVLGIGVDDSFVIVNALDRTDRALPPAERVARALSHAGVSIMVTSLTDFVAFAISVSSALPALSAFCMYAALSVLMLFVLQVTFFTPLVALDARRAAAGRIDCCPCLGGGCPCCPAVPPEEAEAAVERGERDPNQLLCRRTSGHPGGLVGAFLERVLAPVLVRPAVAAAVVLAALGFCGLCAWQATELAVQDTQRNFIPDDSYVLEALNKNDLYFGTLGAQVYIMTQGGNYFQAQAALTDIGSRLSSLDYMQSVEGDAFDSWAVAFRQAVSNGNVTGVTHAQGIVSTESAYYTALKAWLSTAGRDGGMKYRQDVVWVDGNDASQGIRAARVSAEFRAINRVVGDRLVIDADRAIEVMDGLRDVTGSWNDLPGGATAYTFRFLTWETFRIIQRELYLSVGLCLAAVFVITLVLIAHPLTSLLVFLCVLMTIVDILGCMNMWGLAIDNVSVIQLVISVGLCVDYSAHVGHAFMTQEGASRPERVVATLGNVGTAVMNGGVSTFLATMLLGLSRSYVFRVLFQTFFLTVLLGLLHGLVCLPALLSFVGPASYGGHEGEKAPGGAQEKAAGPSADARAEGA